MKSLFQTVIKNREIKEQYLKKSYKQPQIGSYDDILTLGTTTR